MTKKLFKEYILFYQKIAQKLVKDNKGLIATDEKPSSANKRLSQFNIPATYSNRIAYREIICAIPKLSHYINGIILNEEVISAQTTKGIPFYKIVKDNQISLGIKVDEGTKAFIDGSKEFITCGIETLEKRLQIYKTYGALFTKWRAAFVISPTTPSIECIEKNCDLMTEYACIVQKNGLVPILEPEVLMDGNHSISDCFDATSIILSTLFKKIKTSKIELTGMLLKPNMVIAGTNAKNKSTPQDVAEKTTTCLLKTVQKEVAGIVFLSGGQSPIEATMNLNAINNTGTHPWPLSFSFDRAFILPVLKTWLGKKENISLAQNALLHRLQLVNSAVKGQYLPSME